MNPSQLGGKPFKGDNPYLPGVRIVGNVKPGDILVAQDASGRVVGAMEMPAQIVGPPGPPGPQGDKGEDADLSQLHAMFQDLKPLTGTSSTLETRTLINYMLRILQGEQP